MKLKGISLLLALCLSAALFGKVSLYYKPKCPYCVKVIEHLEETGKTVELEDLSQDNRGIKQVPCLNIDGELLYESDEIIKWIDKNYDLQK